jgi:uncharacterized repeat protein (TIGR01451 family)
VESGNGEVVVSWTPGLLAAGDVTVYRSLVSGGGFDPITVGVSGAVYTDTDVTNGVRYYYAATERDAAGNESALSTEASALPFAPIGWAGNLEPTTITHTIGITPTGPISAQVWIDGVTNAPGQGENVWAQLGWGITGTLTDTWAWAPMSYVGDVGNNDQYALALTPEMTGTFQYLARFSSNQGEAWTYAYTGGGQKGTLLVEAAADTTPPATPTNLTVIDWSADDIVLQWDPVADPDLYAYDVFRYGAGQTAMDAVAVGRALAPSTVFTDDTVTTGETYTYTVRALDDVFNASGFSNPATGVAEPKLVDVVFEVTVPDYTPDAATIYIVGDNEMAFGAMWDPSAQPMHHLGGDTWVYTATVGDGTALQYKYTRGDWDRVENWGTLVGTANRQITVDYGTDGTMMVQNQVYNWRDPLVIDHLPATDATTWDVSSPISVTFSRMLDTGNIDDSVFVLEEQGGDIITGTFGFDQWVEVFGDPMFGTVHVTGTVVLVTPTVMLQTDQGYQVTLIKEGYVDDVTMRTDYAWTFGATAPILHLDKSVALTREPAYPGDPITYTLVLSNSGLADAAGVVVTDTLPTGVIGLDVDETITVAAGTQELLTVHALVDVGTWGETITNTAFYAHASGAGSDAAAFTVLGETTVALTKTVEPGMALDWGDTVTYTLQVHNTGSAMAADVLLTDTVPMSVTFGGFVMDNGAMLLGDTVVWAGDIAPDALATVVFTATVNADADLYGTTVTNQAALTAFNAPATEDQAGFTVKAAPALTVVKTAAPTSDLYPGDIVTYTIVLTNTGEALAQGIMLTDTLPAQLAFDGWIVQPMAATVQGRTVRWQGKLDGSDSLTFVFRASVHEETAFVPLTLVNTVSFTSDNGGSGSDDVEIQVAPPALMIHKAVTPTQDIALGGVVRYTVQVSNSEMTPASGVVVTDVLPTGVIFGGWVTRPTEGLIWSSWAITWTGTLDDGAPLTLVFTATLGTDEAFYDQTFTNVAYVTSANAGSGAAEASFTVETGTRYLYLPIMLRQYPDVGCVQCGDR